MTQSGRSSGSGSSGRRSSGWVLHSLPTCLPAALVAGLDFRICPLPHSLSGIFPADRLRSLLSSRAQEAAVEAARVVAQQQRGGDGHQSRGSPLKRNGSSLRRMPSSASESGEPRILSGEEKKRLKR